MIGLSLAGGSIISGVTGEFLIALKNDATRLQQAAQFVFYWLVTIQFAWSVAYMVLSGESLQGLFTKLIMLSLRFGVFYYLIEHGHQLFPEIINGFIQIGQTGGVSSLDPGSLIDQGLGIANGILNGFLNWGVMTHPFVSLVGFASFASIVILYTYMSAELVIVLIKAYLLVTLGPLFMSFGASDQTKPMAINYIKAILGIGLQLMTMYLILGIGQQLGTDWAGMTQDAAAKHELQPMLVILITTAIFFYLLKNIPPFIAGLCGLGGFRNHGDAAVALATSTGMTAANAVMRTVSAGGVGAQALAQFTKGSAFAANHFGQGFGAYNHASAGLVAGLAKAGSASAVATGHLLKDALMKNNTQLSAGQKFNYHMANTLKPKGGKS